MLGALKRMYLYTTCIVSSDSEFSEEFQTYTGIRQGATSSVYLFIAFMDDLVQFLEDECIHEPLINIMHCLLHADDTAIISTSRELFIIKCNKMLVYFRENCLTLNLKKSSYMIINGKEEDIKSDIYLEDEKTLEYNSSYVYLGVVITDNGNLRYDLETFIDSKRSNVTIKYNNLIRKHVNMPLKYKLQVLAIVVSAPCSSMLAKHGG